MFGVDTEELDTFIELAGENALLIDMDIALLRLINGLSARFESTDLFVLILSQNYILKGVFVMMVFWGLWFSKEDQYRTRAQLTIVMMAGVVSIIVGRLFANLLPFRLRPVHDEQIEINQSFHLDVSTLSGWSSMPSDHALLFFAIATCIWFIKRWLGAVLVLHAVVVISLPRIYLGLHFPSDVIVGAILGGAVAVLMMRPAVVAFFERLGILKLEARYPALFYAVAFFVAFQIATMFDSLRELGLMTTALFV